MTLGTRPAKVYSLLFLDNRRLATGGTDNRIWIWDLNSRQADVAAGRPHRHGGRAGLRRHRHHARLGQLRHDASHLEPGRAQAPATASRKSRATPLADAASCTNCSISTDCREAARGIFQHPSRFVFRQKRGSQRIELHRSIRNPQSAIRNRPRRCQIEALESRRLMADDTSRRRCSSGSRLLRRSHRRRQPAGHH